MRQAGMLHNEIEARRFASYLLTLGIRSQVDPEDDGWAIWIRDEDHLAQARSELELFRGAPNDQKYAGVEQAAQALQREEQRQNQLRRRNLVDVRAGQSAAESAQRAPFVMVLIGLCLLVFVMSDMGERVNGVLEHLLFCRVKSGQPPRTLADGFVPIRQGEIWRLVTPIFIHFGIFHLVMNLQALYVLGAAIEQRRGTVRLALMVFSIAIVSNLLQFSWGPLWQASTAQSIVQINPWFGGISGVVFGLFGYVWMKSKFDPASGFYLPPTTVFLCLLFYTVCVLRDLPAASGIVNPLLPNVANTAHTVGLVMGIAYGYIGSTWRRRSA
ncbi:MAG: rhomboid family intramembrane serine protease [Planctomycetes bacterium]|nr:rhomboid family intramembrane serine protease [Planctomycetota bacterium]